MMENSVRMVVVYKITHIPSGRNYIGITSRPLARRWNEHVKTAYRNTRSGALQGAIVKHGAGQFSIDAIEGPLSSDEACDKERFYITTMKTKWPDGFNMSDGGERRGGFRWSDETKMKMRASASGRVITEDAKIKMSVSAKVRWGIPEYKAKMCKAFVSEAGKSARVARAKSLGKKYGGAMLGKQHSPESKEKMSASHKGSVAWNAGVSTPETVMSAAKAANTWKGRQHTAEWKAKMSAIRKGRVMSEETKAKIRETKKINRERKKLTRNNGGALGRMSEAA